MGLDMYLTGEKFFWTNWENPEKNRMEDGNQIETIRLRLGYWRKHPNLHGYIIKTFAGGKDECQQVGLDIEQIRNIIDAVKGKKLPPTSGFFFGQSNLSAEEIADDVAQLEKAATWLETKELAVSRSVFYRASW